MTNNSEEHPQPSNSDICKGCKKEIEKGARRCHHCGEYQAIWRVLLIVLPPIVAFITIVILFGQLYISRQQLTETKAKRIEASEVLKEVQKVKVNAESVLLSANEASEKADIVLANANTKVDQLSQKVEKADENLNTFTNRQKKLSKEVNVIKTELTAEVKKLKERNEIVALADTAISEGDAASYEELKRKCIKLRPNEEMFNVAVSSLLRVKNFYAEGTRIKGVDIYRTKPDGTKLINDGLETEYLIKYLLGVKNWTWRNKAALLLGKRKQKGVPDALIIGMEDDRLDVRRACIKSFEALTGYDNPDVLEYKFSIEWWAEHKDEWEKGLPK